MDLAGSIQDNKELVQAFTPLLLAAISLQGATDALLLSSHPLDGVGGPPFPGIGILPAGNYIGRIAQQDISALQHQSSLGIDRITSITLHLLDGDNEIYNNYCNTYGFRGATMRLALVLWQAGTPNFSSDAPLQFIGTCDMEVPTQGGTVIQVSANNSHNTATVFLPNFPLENRCALHFPMNAAEREQANKPDSKFCPYAPDQGGPGNKAGANLTDIYGNVITDDNGIFTSCDFTRSNPNDLNVGCMARLGDVNDKSLAPDGNLEHDQHSNRTGAFTGIEWSPGTYYSVVKSYTSGDHPAFSFLNGSILGQYANMLYGRQMVLGQVANVVESGDDTKMEVVLCDGDIGGSAVSHVIVNGVELGEDLQTNGNLGWTFAGDGIVAATGGRNGVCNRFPGYNDPSHKALGDPFGSLARIIAIVYKDIFTGFGTPTVQVIASGPQVWVYDSPTSKSLQGFPANSNPAWVLFDILQRCNFLPEEIDIQSFIDTAAICNTTVPFINQAGTLDGHARFKCQFVLQQRRSGADVIAGVLRCFNGYTYWDGGLLHLGMNQTLVESQPITVPGSNYDLPYNSYYANWNPTTASTSLGTGHVAYHFDESTINRIGTGDATRFDIEFEAGATTKTPNKINIQFQDEERQFVQDSLGEIDPDALLRAGGDQQPGGSLVPETLNVLGISNFDQGVRIANVYMAERQRGNEADDPRGTRILRIGTSGIKVAHLHTGHLVLVSLKMFKIDKQLFRVIEKKVSTDYKTATLKLRWTNDIWYTDIYGQTPQTVWNEPNLNKPVRPPKPWQPYGVQPNALSIFDSTEWNFNVAEIDTLQADNSVLVQLQVSGVLPVNIVTSSPGPPLVPLEASLGSGGTLDGDTRYLIQLCAIDANGGYSNHSATISAKTPSGGGNSLTLSNISWMHGTVEHDVFVGTNYTNITHQFTGSGTPSTITINNLPNKLAYGPPDLKAGTGLLQAKTVIHGGIIGINVSAVSGTTIDLSPADSGLALTADLTGYKVMLVGKKDVVGMDIPYDGFTIASNSGYTLTLNRDVTGLIDVNDIILISATATISSANTIGNPLMVNPYFPAGASVNDINMLVRIISGKGRYQIRTIQDVGRVTASLTADITDTATSISVNTTSITDGQYILLDADEYVLVTAGGGTTTLTVDRGALSSTAVAHTSGTEVQLSGTSYTVSNPWNVIPDETSVFIVEEPNWRYTGEVTSIRQAKYNYGVFGSLNVNNYTNHLILVQALIGDAEKRQWSIQARSPFRMFWLYGAGERLIEKDRATFGIGIGEVQPIGNDLTNRFMVRQPDGGGTFIEAVANCKTPAVGATLPLYIDIKVSRDQGSTWASVFPSGSANKMVIHVEGANPTHQVSVTTFAAAPNDAVAPGDWLRIDLLTGSDEGSSAIEFTIRWGAIQPI